MRLIDADALMEYLLEKLAMYDSVGAKMGLVPLTIRNDLQGFVEMIKEQPTIDAVPVVHSGWSVFAEMDLREEELENTYLYAENADILKKYIIVTKCRTTVRTAGRKWTEMNE